MFTFTELADPYAHRIETRRTLILLDQLVRVHEVNEMHNRASVCLVLTNGTQVFIAESIKEVEKQIEAAQKKRLEAIINTRIEQAMEALTKELVQRLKSD